MKISTEIQSCSRYVGEQKCVELVAKAGFDAFDFSMFNMAQYDGNTKQVIDMKHPLRTDNYLAFARELKHIGLENGIVCNQSHAPFPTHIPGVYDMLRRAIECTAEAGGEICVIHPPYKLHEQNTDWYLELLPFAKDHGVKIAIENMFGWDPVRDCPIPDACATPQSFADHMNAIDDPFFVACLDVGHAEQQTMETSAVELIHTLGPRLKALHLHDNDRRIDLHQLPLTMDIDFHPIVKALKEIHYDGYFTLEASNFNNNITADEVPSQLKKMADAAHTLAVWFEE